MSLLDTISDGARFVSTLILGGGIFWFLHAKLKDWVKVEIGHAAGRERIRRLLTRPAGESVYHAHLTAWLARLDRALTPRAVHDVPDPGGSLWNRLGWLMTPLAPTLAGARRSGRALFGWPLLDVALRIAVVYPIGLMALLWILFGLEGRIGPETVLFPADAPGWARLLLALSITILLAGQAMAGRLSGSAQPASRLVVLGIALALALAAAAALAVALASAAAAAVALAMAAAVAGAAAAAGAVRRDRAWAGYAGLVLGLGLLLTAAAALAPADAPGRPLLLFLGVLPLVNAVFDFVSFGVTRALVRTGLNRPEWAFPLGALDLVFATLVFLGLGCTLIAIVHGLNAIAPAPLYDLGALFADLGDEARRWDHLWLWLMVFSTFLPTFLHYALSTWAIAAHVPLLSRPLLDRLDRVEEDPTVAWTARGWLYGLACLGVLGPLLLISGTLWALSVHLPEIGETFLWVFEDFAAWIGAVPPPEPLPWWRRLLGEG